MRGARRLGPALLLVAVAFASPSQAQIPGMPLFTNPRYGTGLRLHADVGQPTKEGTSLGSLTVLQGGVTFALGPLGIGANVGAKRNDFNSALNNSCANCSTQTAVTGSALAQLRFFGGGRSPWSISAFGGASLDFNSYDYAKMNLTPVQVAQLQSFGLIGDGSKQLTIPVGASIGLHVPLGFGGLNLWGAPRMNIMKYINCPTGSTACNGSQSKFRWAVGADFPIFRILSVRAAFDSGKEDLPGGGTQTVSVFGVGASIGIGGMR